MGLKGEMDVRSATWTVFVLILGYLDNVLYSTIVVC